MPVKDSKAAKTKKRGRPQGTVTGKAKSELMQVRLDSREKQAFADAAELDGKDVSEWVRDRLPGCPGMNWKKPERALLFLLLIREMASRIPAESIDQRWLIRSLENNERRLDVWGFAPDVPGV